MIIHKHTLKPWFNKEICILLKEKKCKYEIFQIFKNTITWNEYKRIRNKVVKKIRMLKKDWYEKNIDSYRNDPSKMWKVLKSIVRNDKKCSKIDKIEIDNVIFQGEKLIADKISEYYMNSINVIVNSIPPISYISTNVNNSGLNELSEFETIDLSNLKNIVD